MLTTKTKNLYVKEWIFPLLFVVFALILEMVNFLTLNIGLFPTYILYDIATLLIFVGILSLMKTGGTAWICVASCFLFIQALLNMVNATLSGVFNDIFSVSMIFLGEEGLTAFKFKFLDFLSIFLNLLVLGAFIFTCIYLKKHTKSNLSLSKQGKFTIVLSCFIAFQALGFCLFTAQTNNMNISSNNSSSQTFNDDDLWQNQFLKTESLQRFGTYGFYIKNLANFLLPQKKLSDDEQKKVKADLKAGENYKVVSPYSNIAQGDNLIYIMLESFDTFSIDPVFTPFLWQMRTGQYDGAQYMDNFYARNKTNISEEISFLGHIANTKLYGQYVSSVGINQPYSLPNLMRNDGAEAVNYFHGYKKSYYQRAKVNVALGFEKVYDMNDSTLDSKSKEFEDWILDSDYIANMIDTFIPSDKRFFSYYTTIATHGPYNYKNKRITANLQYVNEHFGEYIAYAQRNGLNIPSSKGELNKYKQFKAFTMDTDKMVKTIFDTLEQRGLLETTTVVMFADHNAFYDDMCFSIKGVAKDDYSNTEGNHLPCFIYNDQLSKGVNKTFCNTYDLYPTLCDMFGFSYNTALTQGYSVFSEEIANSVFVSSLSGMYTNNIFTADLEEIVTLDASVTQQDVERFVDNLFKYYDKQKLIELIYSCNYFKNYA